jgi:hypothetical protein
MMKLCASLLSSARRPQAAADLAGPFVGPVSVAASACGRGLRLALMPAAVAGLLLMSGCDQLGIEDPAKVAAAKEAEGKAIGGACRNAMRAIEDCYALNPKAQKAAVYDGWREMDEYMRENKLEGTRPVVAHGAASKPADASADAGDAEEPAKGSKSDKADKTEKADKSDKAGKGKNAG